MGFDVTLGLGNLIGSGINAISEHISQKQQFKNQKELQNLAYQQQIDLIDKQNEYNSPEQQMARYKQAGLNPYAMLGGVTSGTQSSAGSVPAYPSVQGGASGKALAHLAEAFNMADLRLKTAQAENVEQDTENKRTQNEGNKIANSRLDEQIQVDIDYKKNQIRVGNSVIDLNDAKQESLEIENYINQLCKDWRVSSYRLQMDLMELDKSIKEFQDANKEIELQSKLDEVYARIDHFKASNHLAYKQAELAMAHARKVGLESQVMVECMDYITGIIQNNYYIGQSERNIKSAEAYVASKTMEEKVAGAKLDTLCKQLQSQLLQYNVDTQTVDKAINWFRQIISVFIPFASSNTTTIINP